MDLSNTLQFLYGDHSESVSKYLEVAAMTFDVMAMPVNWHMYLDDVWNTSVPKMIDNALILIEARSLN
jgi:hypothetical protein